MIDGFLFKCFQSMTVNKLEIKIDQSIKYECVVVVSMFRFDTSFFPFSLQMLRKCNLITWQTQIKMLAQS